MISFRFDAPEESPAQIVRALQAITEKRAIVPDSYSIGGIVNEFEDQIAEMLGKEHAIFMPTGTLANHLAIRTLAKGRKRILVQKTGHIYNDTGDACQVLSGFNLIPLGGSLPQYSLEDAQKVFTETANGKVSSEIGALVIENPVRRCHGASFGYDEIDRLTSWAKKMNIGTHLDGARLFIASVYTGIAPKDYAAHFDTVYTSLYKYFGTPSGAVIAGPKDLLNSMRDDRRMFGGSLNQAWIFACLALDTLPFFAEQFLNAVNISERLIELLSNSDQYVVSRIKSGTNIFSIKLKKADQSLSEHDLLEKALSRKGIFIPKPENGEYYLKVNTSLHGQQPQKIADDFIQAAKEIF